MSTCAELPQFGCCGVDTRPVGFYGVYVNEFPGSPQIISATGANIPGLAATLREKLSAIAFPTNPNKAFLYRWNYIGELELVGEVDFPATTISLGTGGTSTGEVFQVFAGLGISKDFSSPTYRIIAGKAMAVTESRLIPSCVGDLFYPEVGASSQSCLANRLTASAQLPFSSGYDYRLDLDKKEFEVMCPPLGQTGRALRTASWVASGLLFGTVPTCCDLSPLPP